MEKNSQVPTLVTDQTAIANFPLRLYEGLRPIVAGANSLHFECKLIHEQLEILDTMPRHDSVIDDVSIMAKVGDFWSSIRPTLETVIRELKNSHETLTRTHARVHGMFRGETKVKTEDRLVKHLAQAKEMLSVFEQLKHGYVFPRQPYLIRQHRLSILLLSFNELINLLTALRRGMSGCEIGEAHFKILDEQNRKLIRLRSDVAKWRDNPSQHMAMKLKSMVERAGEINKALADLSSEAYDNCRRAGIRFYNRAGLVE